MKRPSNMRPMSSNENMLMLLKASALINHCTSHTCMPVGLEFFERYNEVDFSVIILANIVGVLTLYFLNHMKNTIL